MDLIVENVDWSVGVISSINRYLSSRIFTVNNLGSKRLVIFGTKSLLAQLLFPLASVIYIASFLLGNN